MHLLHRRVHFGVHCEVVYRYYGFEQVSLHQVIGHLRERVSGDPRMPHLAMFPGDAHSLHRLIGNPSGFVLVMQEKEVYVVGLELPQARIEVVKNVSRSFLLRLGPPHHVDAFRAKDDPVTLAFEGRAQKAFVVALLIVAGGSEAVDAHVIGPLDDRRVGGDHGAEDEFRYFQVRPAELCVADRRFRCQRSCGRQHGD